MEDIKEQLEMRKPVLTFKASNFRSNLYYEVCLKALLPDPYDDLVQFAVRALKGLPESVDDCWVRIKLRSLDVADFL